MKLRLLPAAVAFLSAAPAVARAAPANPCQTATMTPTQASIPANLPGFAYSATNATVGDVHLFVLGATKTEVPLTLGKVEGAFLQVTPAAQMTPGARYELQFATLCSFPPFPTTPLSFTAAAAAPLPSTLGTAALPPSARATLATGDLAVGGVYTLSAEMKPWRALYTYFIVVDGGERVIPASPQASSNGDELDLLAQSSCTEVMAAKTTHTVQARATLAFAPTVETPVVSIDFTCTVPPQTITVGQYPTSDGGATESSRSHANSNCSAVRGTSSTSSFTALALVLAAAVVGWGRRVSRRRRSSRRLR